MDNMTNVTPMSTTWTQTRQTKLGLAIVTIRPEGDLVEAIVTISHNNTRFIAKGIFSSVREAFLWAYGVKQTRNDRYAGYVAKDNNLIESQPPKGRTAHVMTRAEALIESQSSYDNFTLTKESASASTDKVSLSAVKASSLLNEEEKVLMVNLFAKLGKVYNA